MKWSSAKARRVLAALLRIGWRIKHQSGSHKKLEREGWDDYTFAFHDGDEIGPRMLARIAAYTGLTPEDMWLRGQLVKSNAVHRNHRTGTD